MTDIDENICDQMEVDIENFLKKNDAATKEEIAVTLMGACASVMTNVRCKDCRALAAEWALKNFHDIITDAMTFAAEEFGDDPPIGHVH